MLRRNVLGRRVDEFLLDVFIACFAAGNLFHPLAPAAAAALLAAIALCVDFSALQSPRVLYDDPKGRRSVPRDFGRPG